MHIEETSPHRSQFLKSVRVSPSLSRQNADSQGGVLEWWYRLAAPLEPLNSTSSDRERIRTGRLASIILLIIFGFGLSLIPNALSSRTHTFLFSVLSAMIIDIIALVLNKRGKVMLVGITMVIVVEAAFFIVDITLSPGLSTSALKIFYLIVITELIAVSLLPPKSVFLVAVGNGVFSWAAITFQARTPDLKALILSSYYNVLATPLVLQIIVAIVTYLWVQGATQAIERAEKVAALERELAERDRVVAEQKQQLELGIQQILQTHIQVANGNFEARAPLAQDNVLWQVSYSLNNLLTRMQRALQSENELQRTQMEARRLLEAVHSARTWRHPIQAQRSGTVLDPLIQELTGNIINQQ